MPKAELPWHVAGHEKYLDGVIESNAGTIVKICADDRDPDDKFMAARGLIRHAIVRALQAERGEVPVSQPASADT
jgi:hypothetical protein